MVPRGVSLLAGKRKDFASRSAALFRDFESRSAAQAALELVGDTSHVYESIEKQLAEPIRMGSVDKIASQQRTALGIVVVGNTVESTVSGSPAASSYRS